MLRNFGKRAYQALSGHDPEAGETRHRRLSSSYSGNGVLAAGGSSAYFTHFLAVLVTAVLCFWYVDYSYRTQKCLANVSGYSPANQAVEYVTFDFENEFKQTSVYKGQPSPQLERAWEELWNFNGVRIPESKLVALNRTRTRTDGKKLHRPNDRREGYLASLEVFHQLHCLNLIRQFTYRDWYLAHEDKVARPDKATGPMNHAREHVDHCIETLRQTLMCHGDVTPYLFIEAPELSAGGLRADLSPQHTCRRWDKITEWAGQMQLSEPHMTDWEPPR